MRSLALAVLTAGLFACSSSSESSSSAALQTDELPAYGMNYGGVNYDDIHVERLAAVNMGLERAWWPVIADVHAYDEIVYKAASTNVSIVPIVFGYWPGGYQPAANGNAWRTYIAAISTRFGPKATATTGTFWQEHPELPYLPVRAWEIWNEENTPMFWTYSDQGVVSPANYYDILLNAHQVLRSVDPNARIVFGGLTNFPDRHPHDALDFLAQVTNMPNGKCLYDAVAIHPYSKTVELAVNRVQDTRDRLDNGLGLKDVDIWITEVGWALAGPWQRDAQGLIAQTPFTTPNQYYQAKHFADFAQAMDAHRAEWRIGPTIWFNYQDAGIWDGDDQRWDFHCGMFAFDDQHQPTVARKAWEAVKVAANKTQSVKLPPVRCPK